MQLLYMCFFIYEKSDFFSTKLYKKRSLKCFLKIDFSFSCVKTCSSPASCCSRFNYTSHRRCQLDDFHHVSYLVLVHRHFDQGICVRKENVLHDKRMVVENNGEKLPKVRSKSTTLLQCLCEHLIFSNIVITDGATSEFHCFLEVGTSDFWYWVFVRLEFLKNKMCSFKVFFYRNM